jgi:uncharacterized protein YaaN involved in tellurite resistance
VQDQDGQRPTRRVILVEVVEHLDRRDLERYQDLTARIEAIELCPEYFKREEIIAAFRERYEMTNEFIRIYDVSDTSGVAISPCTGSIWVGEELI